VALAARMKRTIGFFLFVVGILLAPVLFWLFGPMLFWPLSRMHLAADDKRIGYFKIIFLTNLLFVVGGSLLVVLSVDFSTPNTMYLFAIPYSIGVTLLMAGIVVFFVGRDRKR
jgi:hypothetical protein